MGWCIPEYQCCFSSFEGACRVFLWGWEILVEIRLTKASKQSQSEPLAQHIIEKCESDEQNWNKPLAHNRNLSISDPSTLGYCQAQLNSLKPQLKLSFAVFPHLLPLPPGKVFKAQVMPKLQLGGSQFITNRQLASVKVLFCS